MSESDYFLVIFQKLFWYINNEFSKIPYILPLLLGSFLFSLGISGISFLRKNVIMILISIEIMLLGLSFLFIVHSIYLNDPMGQLFALVILSVAGAESAIGLAILILFYRIKFDINLSFLYGLRS